MFDSHDVEQKQEIEIKYWQHAEFERPGVEALENLMNKFPEARIFFDCLKLYGSELPSSGRVLELGAGQGWASCLLKKFRPQLDLITSDISPYAVESIGVWERIYGVKVSKVYASRSFETREKDASCDAVFCFAAAHHFLEHKKTLKELGRILKPGGKAFYFYEPVTSPLFYRAAYWRVNRKRPSVPEDVLVTEELAKLSKDIGLKFRVDYSPTLFNRGAFEAWYFFVLSKFPFLQKIFPCTAHLVFER